MRFYMFAVSLQRFYSPSSCHFFEHCAAGASLIAIHKGKYYKRKDGLAMGPGPFVAAIEYSTGAKVGVELFL